MRGTNTNVRGNGPVEEPAQAGRGQKKMPGRGSSEFPNGPFNTPTNRRKLKLAPDENKKQKKRETIRHEDGTYDIITRSRGKTTVKNYDKDGNCMGVEARPAEKSELDIVFTPSPALIRELNASKKKPNPDKDPRQTANEILDRLTAHAKRQGKK